MYLIKQKISYTCEIITKKVIVKDTTSWSEEYPLWSGFLINLKIKIYIKVQNFINFNRLHRNLSREHLSILLEKCDFIPKFCSISISSPHFLKNFCLKSLVSNNLFQAKCQNLLIFFGFSVAYFDNFPCSSETSEKTYLSFNKYSIKIVYDEFTPQNKHC